MRDGLNLTLIGPRGTGKTQAATLLCAEAARAGHTALRLDWGRFARRVRASYSDASLPHEDRQVEAAVAPALLLLDDVGAADRATDHNERLLTAVIGERHDRGRPTLLTANLGRAELERHLGPRAFDRLDAACDWIVFDGPRHRAREEAGRVRPLVEAARREAGR